MKALKPKVVVVSSYRQYMIFYSCKLFPKANEKAYKLALAKKIFTRTRHGAQREAIKRRYIKVNVRHPLMASGAPFTPAEKRARRDAGANGPQGPGVGP